MGHIERVKVGENSPQGDDDMMWTHPREREERTDRQLGNVMLVLTLKLRTHNTNIFI
jgi:hypothetical protein